MRGKIDCFLPCEDIKNIDKTLSVLRQNKTVQHINLLVDSSFRLNHAPEDCAFRSRLTNRNMVLILYEIQALLIYE